MLHSALLFCQVVQQRN